MANDDLEDLLADIAAADDKLVEALDARAAAYRRIAELTQEDPDLFVRLPRDEMVIRGAREASQAFPSGALEPVFREVLGACASLMAPRKVAYHGHHGGFAHLAARRHFGSSAEYISVPTVQAALDEVARGRVEYAVMPVETSSDGAVTATLVGLQASDTRICAELEVNTTYHLLSSSGNTLDVEKVYGDRTALASCSRFLSSELARATVIDVPSAEVAAELAGADPGAAIVGTEMVSEVHGLKIARESIDDHGAVQTRFAIVGTEFPSRTGNDHTIVAVAVHDVPGALSETLRPFASRGVNLTKLESRPTAQWRYLFFLEMDGHVTDRALLTALEELRTISRFVKVLGSYPRSG